MIYLLITTTENRNTGDELIRIGVQNLIREIDPQPEFIFLDKEKWINPSVVKYDKVVLCGMPLFWNNEVSASQTIGWWGAIFRYSGIKKENFLILGVGSVWGKYGIYNKKEYKDAIQEAIDSSFAVTDRDYTHAHHPGVISSICPSAFAIDKPKEGKYKLCNLMFYGAHDRHFNDTQADYWKLRIKEVSAYCLANNYYFIEHAQRPYYENGEELGWSRDRIIRFNTAEEYLHIYAHAKCFFGNRLHGAFVTGSLGKPALAVGYDSRTDMLRKIGIPVKYPTEFYSNIEVQIKKLEQRKEKIPDIVKEEKEKLLKLIRDFISR